MSVKGPGALRGQETCLGAFSGALPRWGVGGLQGPGPELSLPATALKQPSRGVHLEAPPSPVRPELSMSNASPALQREGWSPRIEGHLSWESWGRPEGPLPSLAGLGE